jgi:hypothetical protein
MRHPPTIEVDEHADAQIMRFNGAGHFAASLLLRAGEPGLLPWESAHAAENLRRQNSQRLPR